MKDRCITREELEAAVKTLTEPPAEKQCMDCKFIYHGTPLYFFAGYGFICPECIEKRLRECPKPGPTYQELDERRITDPKTGGQKGSKLARFDLLPGDALWAVAEHFGRGAVKYGEDRNWEKGYAWSLSFAALMRHAWAWWQGEDKDAETGSSHLAAVAWHALVLLAFELRGAGTDNRPEALEEAGPTDQAAASAAKNRGVTFGDE